MWKVFVLQLLPSLKNNNNFALKTINLWFFTKQDTIVWRCINRRLTAPLFQGADGQPELNYSCFPDAGLFTSIITVNTAADLAISFTL